MSGRIGWDCPLCSTRNVRQKIAFPARLSCQVCRYRIEYHESGLQEPHRAVALKIARGGAITPEERAQAFGPEA